MSKFGIRQFRIQVLAGVRVAAFVFCATWMMIKTMNCFPPIDMPDVVKVSSLGEGQFGEQAFTL